MESKNKDVVLPPWVGPAPKRLDFETDRLFEAACERYAKDKREYYRILSAIRRRDPVRHRRNLDRQLERHKERYATDPEYRAAKNRATLKCMRRNPDKYREKARQLHARRYAEDPQYRLKCNLKVRYKTALRVTNTKAAGRMNQLIGCTPAELRRRLEGQFSEGMSWENYGEWVVDHRLPICMFDMKCPLQQVLCFGFWNLRPLWFDDNQRKVGEDMRMAGIWDRRREMVSVEA